ncbi:hypothetical protein AAF712_006080 [Marasmius tenuissimus]|uniref:polynucleotide adenylyltransferase n=1 Tax=Marasmius tenuissimus TaxID=585030 RepID=A0ABR2ZYV5_9AGAR
MQPTLIRCTKQCKRLGSIKSFLSPSFTSIFVLKRSLTSVVKQPSTNVKKKRKPEFERREELNVRTIAGFQDHKDVNQRLHHEIVAYIKSIEATHKERVQRHLIYETFRNTINETISSYRPKVQLYGSVPTGLELPTTDLDISVSTSRKSADRKEQTRILRKLRFAFREAGLIYKGMIRAHARVPVMVMTTSNHLGRIGIDITVNSDDGPRCVKVINQYLKEMPALRPLILLLKCFLKEKRLNNAATGGLSSYSLTCMCISLLQVNPGRRPQEYIDKPMEFESLGALLTDFMVYYGRDFSYKNSFISVLQGKVLPKQSIEWLTVHDALAIECLVRDRNSVARSTQYVQEIQSAFKDAAETLLKLAPDNKTCLGSIVQARHMDSVRRSAITASIDTSTPTKTVPKRVKSKYKGVRKPGSLALSRDRTTPFDSTGRQPVAVLYG